MTASWVIPGASRAPATRRDLESGKLKIILQLALEKHKELPNVPLVTEFVSKPDDRQVLELIFSRQSMGRPLVAPPGLDPRVVEALRKGFADAMHDPQFMAEVEQDGARDELRQRCRCASPGRTVVQRARAGDRARTGDRVGPVTRLAGAVGKGHSDVAMNSKPGTNSE